MDFSHEQRFTAKRASGIGVVALAHIILGGALVYGLHTTTVTRQNDGPVVLKPLPPDIVKPVDLPPPPDAHTKAPYIPPIETVQPPPVGPVIESYTAVPPDPTPVHESLFTNPGTGTDGVKPVNHTSTSVKVDYEACKPAYPKQARLAGEEGTVRLKFDVGIDGRLAAANVVKSSGFSDLDRAALNALSSCTFKSATQDGAPIRSSLVTDYVWSLEN